MATAEARRSTVHAGRIAATTAETGRSTVHAGRIAATTTETGRSISERATRRGAITVIIIRASGSKRTAAITKRGTISIAEATTVINGCACRTHTSVAHTTKSATTVINAVTHTHATTETSAAIETSTTIKSPAVTAAILSIEVRTTEIIVITMRISGVNAEVPIATIPIKRTIEIIRSTVYIILPII